MSDPVARTLCTETPMPPALLEILAQSESDSKMPTMESSFIWVRKQDDSCGVGVAALKRVGVAWV